MPSSAKQLALAEVFAEDSEHERTFYGFSDSEIDGHRQVGHVVCKCAESESNGLLRPREFLVYYPVMFFFVFS